MRTTCPYCGVGCGLVAEARDGQAVRIAGDPEHPANRGRLCVKGAALPETLGLEGRLLHPILRTRTHGERRVGWDEALDFVAKGFLHALAEHGPESVAFYVSGQLLTEDYYVANKLMKGYFGAANIDTNSRLCMSSAVAGHVRAFGEDVVPVAYEDLERAELIVLVGSNTAWCHPVLFQRIAAAKRERPELQVVVIDPRRTATVEIADLHLPIRPGTDVMLFNGLLSWLHQHGVADTAFLAAHTTGLEAALAVAEQSAGSLAHVARHCGIGEESLRRFYALFARSEKAITAFSMGVNQSTRGTDKVNAIINCHLLTGRIGKPGAGPFSLTGQPNAMGGREVGGLANQLAAHLRLDDPAHRALVQTFWNSPRIAQRPGLKAVELFEAVHAGRIKVLWVMATNPVVSLPDADRVRAALARCPLVVVSEVVRDTDTARLAHVLLPAAGWGERDGTVTNSERRISRQRPFLPLPGEARPDWWIVSRLAQRMGFDSAFAYSNAYEIFLEHARLSAYRNGHGPGEVFRHFNLGALAALTRDQYDRLEPIRWPCPAVGQGHEPFAAGHYAHADGRARLVAVWPHAPAHATDDDYPLVLNSGRVRDQWHTMTRTGKSPRLAQHTAEPYVEIHPHDALLWGVRAGGLARVSTRWGAAVLRVAVSADIARRQLFVPIHWNGETASDARIGALVNPAVDPISGEPEFKHTPARIEPFFVDWYGFVLARRPLAAFAPRAVADAGLVWWTKVQGEDCLRYEIAGRGAPPDWSGWAQALLGVGLEGEWLEVSDAAEGLYRAAWIEDARPRGSLYLAPRPEDLPPRAFPAALFAQQRLAEHERIALLAGRPTEGPADAGPIVCACFGVGRKTILGAVREGCNSVEALGARLQCGTNCGSCIPELKALLVTQRALHLSSLATEGTP
ncbi:MAG: molybdopterin-dependent oxidoreductase [Nevskia sp.]|nr:molybdopterin-dependent oxidoreductase [Nevskia sp.]